MIDGAVGFQPDVVIPLQERLGDAVLAARESDAASGAFVELLPIHHHLGELRLALHERGPESRSKHPQ